MNNLYKHILHHHEARTTVCCTAVTAVVLIGCNGRAYSRIKLYIAYFMGCMLEANLGMINHMLIMFTGAILGDNFL